MTIVDNFDRADSSTTLGTTSDGKAAWQTALGGTSWDNSCVFGISTDQAYAPSPAGGPRAIVATDASDGTVQVTVGTFGGAPSSSLGLVFRLSDGDNFWAYVANAFSSGFSGLYKFTTGGGTIGTLIQQVSLVSGDVIAVVLSGSSITLKQNGATITTVTDAFNQTATNHGLFLADSRFRLDDFSAPGNAPIRAFPAAPLVTPPLAVTQRASGW
jgi:hypothetical protein